jgi:hypothetical protein
VEAFGKLELSRLAISTPSNGNVAVCFEKRDVLASANPLSDFVVQQNDTPPSLCMLKKPNNTKSASRRSVEVDKICIN